MKTYPIPMVPGPVKAHPAVLEAYRIDYGSADLEKEYVELYTRTEANLKAILQTKASVVIFLGEGMMALWGALKSCLAPGDRVLAIGTGVYGYGIGEMAAAVGAEVRTVGLPYNETLSDLSEVKRAIAELHPKMITVVHCETPSGTLNPVDGLGRLKHEMGVPLLYVDAVSSIGGAPVLPDQWHIDLCLGGAQKCLSALPDTCFLSVSAKAWEIIEQVNYVGYDAIKPFRTAVEKHYFPYTPGWQATAGLNAGAEAILHEGLEACFRLPGARRGAGPHRHGRQRARRDCLERVRPAAARARPGGRRQLRTGRRQGLPAGPHGHPGRHGAGEKGAGCA
jgi:aspartate aminotransferase-like enzyme